MPIPEALQEYATRLGFPKSENLARIFEIIFDGPDDIRLIQAMPGTARELAEKTGMPEQQVFARAEQLKARGAIGSPMRKPDVYRPFPAAIELRDTTAMWAEAPQSLFESWEALITQEFKDLVPLLNELKIPPMIRVLPVEQSIESRNTVLDIDTARNIFKDAELITAVPCPCRKQARKNGRGQNCPAPETAVCMQTNAFAQAILDRGAGEKLSNAEALKRVCDAEEAGLVHMVRNNVKKDMFMCNCCSCCCTGLYLLNEIGYAGAMSPSRFRVKFTEDRCTACGLCSERCSFKAISVNGIASINLDKCFGCGNCVIACPEEALTLEEIRPKEHIRIK